MSNNIISNSPNAVVAKAAGAFTAAGITGTNTSIIFLADTVAKVYKSYVPGRGINAVTAFEVDKGYIIQALQDFDLTAFVVPPLPALPQLSTPLLTLDVTGPSNIDTSWPAVTNATGYTLQRATNSSFTANLVTLVTGNFTSYFDMDLTPATQYFYRLKATAPGYTDSAYDTDSATTDPAVTPPAYILDTFTAADGTLIASRAMDSGESWTANQHAFQITTNAATSQSTLADGDISVATVDALVPGVSIEIQFAYVNTSQKRVGIVCRFIDINNYYLVSFSTTGNGFKIQKISAGVATDEAFANVGSSSSNKLKAVCSGNTITATLDGTTTIQVTNASQGNTATKFGIWNQMDYYGGRDLIHDFLLWPGSGTMPSNPLHP